MKKIVAIFAVLVCYTVLFFLIEFINNKFETKAPIANNGVINLENWDFIYGGNVPLNGEWEFYKNKLLSPEEIHAYQGSKPMYIKTPSNLMNIRFTNKETGVKKGTYRLVIHTNEKDQIFGIKVTSIHMSNSIYVNGKLIGSSGVPSDYKSYEPQNKPYVSYFPIEKGKNEIIVQFANFHFKPSAGIVKPIYFGEQKQISRLRDLSIVNDWLMITAFFMMGLYFFGYYRQRKRDIHLLYFSVFCLMLAINISTATGDRVIYMIFPNMSYFVLIWLQGFSTVLTSVTFVLYLFSAYKSLVLKWIVILFVTLGGLLLILDLLWIGHVSKNLVISHSIMALSALIYATYILTLAVMNKMEGSMYLIIGVLSMGIYIITTTINGYGSVPILSFFSLTSIVFLLMISLLMSLHFSNAFIEIESLSKKLLKIDQLKDEFIAKTSHEFKTPLNGIINICQTILKDQGKILSSKQREKVTLITQITFRLADLVKDILDLSKMKQGMLQVNPMPTDVRPIVTVEIAILALMAEKKQLQIVNQVPTNLPNVLVDENRLRQIVNNLLENAIKYTDQGSVTISAAQENDIMKITVEDTGIGIPQSEFETIFHAFQQQESKGQDGAGLGLSIVKQLVELQGGEIWVESVVGEGSAFHFTLPIAEMNVPIISLQASEAVPATKSPPILINTPYRLVDKNAPTILIVDDNIENLKILIDMIESIPYNVIAVKNGEEALQEIAANPHIDLVILDLMMPGMTGDEVCMKIREMYSLIELPVLIVTAALIDSDKHFAFQVGANDVLQKPFNYSEFEARIQSLIMMKDATSQAIKLETAFLQSQIKPHFLYNVLNSIMALSYIDVEKSRETIGHFASYLRGSFDFYNTSNLTSFEREMSIVTSYVQIEKTRFQERIQVEIDVEPYLDFSLPPLMIQPLVENAIQHGIEKKSEGGWVKLTVRKELDGYMIKVEDNGVGMSEEQLKAVMAKESNRSVGLKNINYRLQHFYGAELQIESELNKGTTITMMINQVFLPKSNKKIGSKNLFK
ncbi:hybrid sensor histidine kinase/response regulator [Niallia sp. 01092]|uniref:hybrid sensor histidine kinase/response regulator n=1 Tax=unclassified Niallia TaxID=2837522 RepID=UPI003FD2713B